MYYDRSGRSITFEQWGALKMNEQYRVVAQDVTKKGMWVSTVWLGIDHGMPGYREIFETMVFDEQQHPLETARYASEEEALEGHEERIRKYGGRRATGPDRLAPGRKIDV